MCTLLKFMSFAQNIEATCLIGCWRYDIVHYYPEKSLHHFAFFFSASSTHVALWCETLIYWTRKSLCVLTRNLQSQFKQFINAKEGLKKFLVIYLLALSFHKYASMTVSVKHFQFCFASQTLKNSEVGTEIFKNEIANWDFYLISLTFLIQICQFLCT